MCPLPALDAPAPSLFMTPTATQHCSLSTPVPSSYCVQAQGGGSVGASWSYGAGMQWEHQPSAQPMRAADGFSQAGCIRPLGVGAVGASPEGHLRGLVVYEHCVQTYMLHSTRVCDCVVRGCLHLCGSGRLVASCVSCLAWSQHTILSFWGMSGWKIEGRKSRSSGLSTGVLGRTGTFSGLGWAPQRERECVCAHTCMRTHAHALASSGNPPGPQGV